MWIPILITKLKLIRHIGIILIRQKKSIEWNWIFIKQICFFVFQQKSNRKVCLDVHRLMWDHQRGAYSMNLLLFCMGCFVVIISPCYKFSCQCTTATLFIFGLTWPIWTQRGHICRSPACKHMLNTNIQIYTLYEQRQTESWHLPMAFNRF